MRKSTKVLLIVALCLILSGAMMCASAVINAGIDFDGFVNFETTERVVTDDEFFTDVDVDITEADVYLYASSEDEYRVELKETDKVFYDVRVENETLVIRDSDARKWHDYMFNFSMANTEVKIYLPHNTYDKICAVTTSGNTEVNEGISCSNLEAKSTSGDVRVYSADVSGSIITYATSGQVTVDGVNASGLYANTVSGDLYISNISSVLTVEAGSTSGALRVIDVRCNGITAETVSGELTLSGTLAENSINAGTTSGEIKLLQCDGGYISINSVSGFVRGTLLSEKIFRASTTSGSVSCPQYTSGGVCEINTVSGDIMMEVVG